jgi:type II secretory pathway pseudopilin PulG
MLMMVAIIGIIAAIAIPSLLRARVSANEAATLGDVRSVVSAQAAYESRAGSYAPLECLASPADPGCYEGYPPGEPAFLDRELAAASTRSGYRRVFVPGRANPTPVNPNGIEGYCFAAIPVRPNQTGIRSFAADETGRMCFDAGAEDLCAGGSLPSDCTPLG